MSVITPTRARTAASVLALSASAALVGPAAAQAAAAPAPCLQRGCSVVARVDVDGDRAPDVVSITPTRSGGGPAQIVRVVTARKAASQVVLRTPWLMGQKPWFGAASLDGAPGAELVIRTGYGAHTQFFGMLSWRSGALAIQKDPSTGDSEWITDGAMSVVQGYRAWTKKGTRMLTTTSLERDLSKPGNTFRGSVRSYAWKNGRWSLVTARQLGLPATSPAVTSAYGWHVRGLPR